MYYISSSFICNDRFFYENMVTLLDCSTTDSFNLSVSYISTEHECILTNLDWSNFFVFLFIPDFGFTCISIFSVSVKNLLLQFSDYPCLFIQHEQYFEFYLEKIVFDTTVVELMYTSDDFDFLFYPLFFGSDVEYEFWKNTFVQYHDVYSSSSDFQFLCESEFEDAIHSLLVKRLVLYKRPHF